MNLNFELPEEMVNVISLEKDEKIGYCSPFDIDDTGNSCKDGYVVVTRYRVIVVKDKRVIRSFILSECERASAESLIDCGIITVRKSDEDFLVVRYSMRHIVRMSYITRGINMFIKGDFHKLECPDPEKICPKCGRAIPGTGFCPHCEGRREGWKRIVRLCSPYILRLSLISLIMAASTGLTLYQQKVQGSFVDDVLSPKDGKTGSVSEIGYYIFLLAIIIVGVIGVNIFKRYLSVMLGSKISMDLRKKLFDKIQTMSLSYQDTRKPGDLMNRVSGDTGEIRRFMEWIFSNMFSYLVTLVGAFVYMLVMDWQLALIAVCLTPFAAGAHLIWRKTMRRMFRTQRQKDDRLNSRLQDVLSGIRVVKCFGKEEYEAGEFYKVAYDTAQLESKNERFWAVFQPLLSLLTGTGSYLILLFGGWKMLEGTGFTIGEMSQFLAYASMLYGPLGWLTQLPRHISRMKVSFSRIDDVLAQTPEITDIENPVSREIEGNVDFRNVAFGYKNYEPVLENINFKVNKGEMIGLVGESGSGKSTMINLIMRLYDADEGEILIDGENIKNYSSQSLHEQIGVVLQETMLFSDTILNNIRFSRPEATLEEVIEAAKTAGAHDFICKFPDGYNTYVGENGQKMSGGERQRIAIARAVLNKPSLLILDEATSSLDTESEFLIQKGLERLRKGRTTFAIAHRLSTLKGANRLFVISDAKIAETGSHDELMKNSTIYKELVKAQLEMHSVKEA